VLLTASVLARWTETEGVEMDLGEPEFAVTVD
jgi:hypothetical protein